MTATTVLISGAGVAGPALAHLLHRDGYRVTVVERAPAVRGGGYAVDFRGAAFEVLDELGILAEVRAHDTRMRGTTLIDASGAACGQLPAEAFAGELEVPKGELTRLLHRLTTATTDGAIEYLFDDSIAALTEHRDGVTVEFEKAAARDFDLVFGADGVFSRVRRLAFVPHDQALHHLGMSGAGFTTDNFLGLDHEGILHTTGDSAVYLFSAGDPQRLTASLSFATASPALDRRPRDAQQEAVRAAFAGHGWEVPRLLDAMDRAPDFFFASTCQVQLDRWSTGRVALLGDAGYCAAPTSGMGTSQALLAARSLARNLAAADGDHRTAFAAYEAELRPYVTENQARGREAAAMFGGGAAEG
ncbi:FAD-dependent monooxygenase [Streptomyces sp. RS10V-4]|uniref:FAD-dependent monooxygenase n=1 Tax=Streptomyces rhizoryzae TaxID=2932493 RepID=UPI002006B791|nr:FAD-dependent monooxygenase [Streptomyces rhizoryzae]MCK7624441.1 FAD-dependent monooxygenase [Streptomyces rhizoryzae]